MNTGSVGATLFQVPNQHLVSSRKCGAQLASKNPVFDTLCTHLQPNYKVFAKDPLKKHRSEDAVIAFTWQQYVQDPHNVEWPLRLPMTKSGVKALDTMDNFMKSATGVHALDSIGHANSGGHELTRFVIAGASKRGWTTWTLASVEPRVIAAGTVY
jgi:PhoPQ-activated pathogenicity-related protein